MSRAGYVLVYLGFGYGLVSLWWVVSGGLGRAGRVGRRVDQIGGLFGAGLVVGCTVMVASLWAPWLTGPAAGGGVVEGSGWELLDPVTTVAVAVLGLAVCTAVGVVARTPQDDGGRVVPPGTGGAASSAAALVLGNALVQGSSPVVSLQWGAWVGIAGALVALLASAGVALRR